jgi:hypothetical protein
VNSDNLGSYPQTYFWRRKSGESLNVMAKLRTYVMHPVRLGELIMTSFYTLDLVTVAPCIVG